MNKRDYFVSALKAQMFIYKKWVIEVFSLTKPEPPADFRKTGWWLGIKEDGGNAKTSPYHFYSDEGDGTLIVLDGTTRNDRLLDLQDDLVLLPGDLPNVSEKVETTYGVALINAMVLCWPFGNKIPYVNDEVIFGARLDSLVRELLVENPESGIDRDPKKIYVDELLKYNEALSAMAGFAQLCTSSASPKTMTIDPAILKRRDELFELNKDRLHDPAVLAAIDGELTKMDRASFIGDDAEDFFIKSKTFDVARKKAYISYGLEAGFGETVAKPVFIKGSLREGLDFNNLPAISDASRSGSFMRGNQTALGGESVKYFYRIFQNTKIAEEDCGSKSGLWWEVNADNWKTFIGRYIAGAAAPVRIDETVAKNLIGRKVLVRSPYLCKTGEPSYCARCAGDSLAMNPTGVHVEISDVGSVFMLVSMKAMHGKALSTAKYQYLRSIT